ncbi:hypothetical protein Csp2054_07395 [Curtobacterium sp. 'Ferrero']|nr:hypothetical protein Csp2054_07395 [Curtobacterium sp. 'Ferrero']
MTDAGDPRTQDRGHYGAGWGQPAPGPGVGPRPGADPGLSPGQQYVPPMPPRRRADAPDPRRAFAPGASVANTTGALIAVVSVIVVEFVSGLVGLLGTSLVVHPFTSYAGESLIGSFVRGVFVAPLPFHVGAFLALAFLVPVARRSPLPVVLLRAVLAGAAGTIALALVGIVTGASGAVRGYGAGRLLVDVVTAPIQSGLPLTLMLVATVTAAWLWLGRPRGTTGRPLGVPGAARRPDAVPPATVPPATMQPATVQQPGAYPQQPGDSWPEAQQPGDPWAPPRR